MKVTSDKEGAEPPLPRIAVERTPEVEPRRFYVSSADIEAHGHTGGCLGCAALASHGRATKPHNNECRERIRTIIERTLTGTARMNAQRRSRRDRGADADRHAVASGEDERQHDENKMRDIHLGIKRIGDSTLRTT